MSSENVRPELDFFRWRKSDRILPDRVMAMLWELDPDSEGMTAATIIEKFSACGVEPEKTQQAIEWLCRRSYVITRFEAWLQAITTYQKEPIILILSPAAKLFLENCELLDEQHEARMVIEALKAKLRKAKKSVDNMVPLGAMIRALGVPSHERDNRWTLEIPKYHEEAVTPEDRIERFPSPNRPDAVTYTYTERRKNKPAVPS